MLLEPFDWCNRMQKEISNEEVRKRLSERFPSRACGKDGRLWNLFSDGISLADPRSAGLSINPYWFCVYPLREKKTDSMLIEGRPALFIEKEEILRILDYLGNKPRILLLEKSTNIITLENLLGLKAELHPFLALRWLLQRSSMVCISTTYHLPKDKHFEVSLSGETDVRNLNLDEVLSLSMEKNFILLSRRCQTCNKLSLDKPHPRCFYCEKSFYCSNGCQRRDWEKHRKICLV
jgi:hypothetical protein